MKAEELRKSILQLAIQGKLVGQNPADEPASVLIERIRAEKQKLIKEGEIKKDKHDSIIYRSDEGSFFEQIGKEVRSIDDEIPFEIPNSWEWVRLEMTGVTTTGTTPSTAIEGYFGKDVPFIKPADIFNTKIIYDNEGLSVKGSEVGRTVSANSVLMVCIGGSIGKCFYTDRKVSFNQQINAISPIILEYMYLFYTLSSSYFFRQIKEKSSGTATEIINKSAWGSILIPLPPFAEQERIVARLGELEPLLAEYEQLELQESVLEKSFPEDLNKAILQYAIQGKLVAQDPADEPASVLLERIRAEKEQLIKGKKIKRDKIDSHIFRADDGSFYERIGKETRCIDAEIPSSWEWCRLGELAIYRKGPFGSSLTKDLFVPQSNDSIKVYEQKNAIQKDFKLGQYFISKIKFESMQGFIVEPNDIIVSCAGTIGETYVLPDEAPIGIINQALMRVRLFDRKIEPFWLMYFDYILKKEAQLKSQGSAIKNIPPFDILKMMLIPIPPLAEQQRIVAKLEQTLTLIK